MASQGLPVRKGPLSSCWLLSVIYPSCSCLKDQPLPLPDACSKKVSMQGCQADQLAKSPPLQKYSPPCPICAWLLAIVQHMFSCCR